MISSDVRWFLLVAGLPLAAFVVRWAVTGHRYARAQWMVVAGFYGAMIAVLVAAKLLGVTPWSVCVVVIFGPVIAVVLLAIEPYGVRATSQDAVPRVRGFEVLPLADAAPDDGDERSRSQRPADERRGEGWPYSD